MSFQWPLALLLLVLVPMLIGLYLLAQRRRQRYAVRFTNLALLHAVVGRGPGRRRHIPAALFLLGLVALLTALARPTAVIAVPRDEATIMIVMDVSGSMAADDLQPDRMAAARQAARAFVQALPEYARVGLVSFSTRARVDAAPTSDHTVVLRAIDRLTPDGGTAIGDGLDLALDQLAAAGTAAKPAPGLVVLLSDGQSSAGISPETAAARAASAHVKVYTVGVGQRGAVPVVHGQAVRLDEASLREIATTTGATYFYAEESGKLQQIYADLGAQIGWNEERTEITALVSALGTLLVLGGGLLSLRWFQRLP
jgi:Ca-activated chloride channel family protein